MIDGPGTQPDSYFYKDEKWGVRIVQADTRVFFYVDAPEGGDDGSFDSILPWADFAKYDRPLFMFGDYEGMPQSWADKLVFKQSCHSFTPADAFFYPVLIDWEPFPIQECDYLAGFIGGGNTHPCRAKLAKPLCELKPSYCEFNKSAWWAYPEEYRAQLRQNYLDLTENTKFVMCPRGRGLNSIRFFEVLRLGRIPVLISDKARLPLEWLIKYDEFVVRVREEDVEDAHEQIVDWLASHDLETASKKAREVSLTYFSDPEKFIKLHL